MEKLGERLVSERNRLFVGRQTELQTVQQWIRNAKAATQVLFLSGIGGIGKTSFMMRALDIAVQAKLRALWIDGRVCADTPTGFMEALFDYPTAPEDSSRREISLPQLVEALSAGRTFLCVDNYDAIQKLDGWLRQVFLPRLPATGLLVLLVARQNLSEAWQNDLAWRNRVSHTKLQPFTRQEVAQYGFRTGVTKSAEIDRLIDESHGLPLALALSSERLHLKGKEAAWPISLRISAELLREVASPDLQEALELLCILPQATLGQIGRLVRSPLNADTLLRLSRISFVRPTAYGFALHDVARHYLAEDFMLREPERVRELRTQIVRELVREIKSGETLDRNKLVCILLSVCRDAFQLDSVSVFGDDPEQMRMEPFHRRDLPELMRLLQQQASYAVSIAKDLAVLQEMADRFPDCIRVFRSKDGMPLAFVAGFYLYGETTLFHEQHFPEVLERAFPHEIAAMRTQAIERTDTFCHLLAAAAENDAEYRFQQLIGIILADWVMLRSSGIRFVMINTYEGITPVLLSLGYKMRPLAGLPDGHPFQRAIVRELDLRTSDAGDWILERLGLEPDADKNSFANNLTERSVKIALSLAKDPHRLAHTELAKNLGLSGAELRQSLHRALWGEPVYPLDQRMQLALRQMSEAAHLTADMAADRLHVSRATYFRVRRDALQALKEFLLHEAQQP